MPAIGAITQPGRTLFASRDRFGKWDHFLGPRHVMVAYVVQPKGDEIRRLEVQAHLGPEGEDDLCPASEFSQRYLDLTRRMALFGVLPSEEPRVVRVDVAVDVEYDDPQHGAATLEALRYARWPGRWYAEWQGAPPYTTVALKSGKHTVARAYCRNSKLKNGRPRFGKIRFEREQRFAWVTARPVEEFASELAAQMYWDTVFGEGRPSGAVRRLPTREVEAVQLIGRLDAREITTIQYEQVLTFLTVERLGVIEKVYSPETARRRRALARRLGLAASAGDSVELDVSLDDLMAAARVAWQVGFRAAA